MIDRVKQSLLKIDYRMFVALLVFGLIPTLYTTFRIFLIGQLPGEWSFSIAGQLQWVNLLYEILQEGIILPLFFFIGAVINDKTQLTNRVKTGLLFTIAVYFILSLLIFIVTNTTIKNLTTVENIIDMVSKRI